MQKIRKWGRHRASAASVLGLVVLLLYGCEEEPASPPPLEIPYIAVEARDVAVPIDVVGETRGSTDVSIRSRVDGFLDGIHFQDGSFVDKGQLLYTIDPQPFQAKLAQAQAAMAEANTSLAKAKSDLARIRPLAEMRAVSAQDLDSAVASHEAALAYVEAAKARVDLADIELGYTRIHSPVKGLIGLTEAEVGDYVSQRTNGGLLNVVSSTDPIDVRVSITETLYLLIARRLARAHESDQPRRGNLTLLLADGSVYEHPGVTTKVDRNIDPTTGALAIEAQFPNPEHILRPGMFARIRFESDTLKGALLVPQRAVNELQSVHRVFVINEQDTVEVRQVQVGPRLGSEWVITSGLEAGDRVAVEGLLRLREGMQVTPRPAAAAED